MRIGFDVTPLCRPHPRGLVRATEGLLAALERSGRHEFVRVAPPAGARVSTWRQRDLPRIVRAEKLDGIHSPFSSFPLRGSGRRVQTVHELPWRHGVRENADLAHRVWAWLGARIADATIVPTEHVARELRRRILPLGDKVHVIPWGVDARYCDEPPLGTIDEVALGRYRLPQIPIALCLNAVRPKKNLSAVIDGLAELRRRSGPPLHLVVSGGDTPQLRKDLGRVARLGLSRYVSTPEEIDERDLPSLVRLASVVPVLSHSEGFGLPVLEAMACGTPVLVPKGSAQAEVAGDVGIVVDPADAGSVADGLARALAQREALRLPLAARAQEFSWDRSAQRVEALWEEIA